MIKAAFLDRDGVINRKASAIDEYITRWEGVRFNVGCNVGNHGATGPSHDAYRRFLPVFEPGVFLCQGCP